MPDYANLRTPPFLPVDYAYDGDYGSLPDSPPPLDSPDADPDEERRKRLREAYSNGPLGGSPPTQVDFPVQPQTDYLPSAKALESLQTDRAAQKQPGLLRRIAGGLVGGWVPALGQEIANPGGSAYNRQRALLLDRLKVEQEALKGNESAQNINSQIENRRLQRQEAESNIALRRQLGEESRARQQQQEIDSFGQRGGQFMPTATTPMDFNPPPLAAPEAPTGIQGPPIAAEQTGAAGMPVRTVPPAPLHVELPPMPPPGYAQVPSAKYDQPGMMRVAPTPAELKRQQIEAQQVNWLPTPAPIKEKYPEAPNKMPKEVLDTYVRLIEADKKGEADRALKEWQVTENINARREIAGMVGGNRADQQNQTRSDKSYQYNSTQLENIAKPVRATAERIGRLKDTLDQGTPQADALVAPELLSIMAGGQGSGLRMNEAEIARIIGGRSNWESLKAAINKWSLDPKEARSITPEQQRQIRALMETVRTKSVQQQQVLDSAYEELLGSDDPKDHRASVTRARKAISNISQGVAGAEVPTPQMKERTDIPDAISKGIAEGHKRPVRTPDGKTIVLTKHNGKVFEVPQ